MNVGWGSSYWQNGSYRGAGWADKYRDSSCFARCMKPERLTGHRSSGNSREKERAASGDTWATWQTWQFPRLVCSVRGDRSVASVIHSLLLPLPRQLFFLLLFSIFLHLSLPLLILLQYVASFLLFIHLLTVSSVNRNHGCQRRYQRFRSHWPHCKSPLIGFKWSRLTLPQVFRNA
jgi:hypothetical protein